MPYQSHDQPEQELSIKRRSHELFVRGDSEDEHVRAKPFEVHLRETAAQPLSALVKAMLWTIGIVVCVLFLAAVMRIVTRHNSPPNPTKKAASTDAPVGGVARVMTTLTADAGLSADVPRWQDKKVATPFTT